MCCRCRTFYAAARPIVEGVPATVPIDREPCTCPEGWPRITPYEEEGWPVAIVQHHWGQCWRSSIRVSGVRRPRAAFEAEVAVVAGERG